MTAPARLCAACCTPIIGVGGYTTTPGQIDVDAVGRRWAKRQTCDPCARAGRRGPKTEDAKRALAVAAARANPRPLVHRPSREHQRLRTDPALAALDRARVLIDQALHQVLDLDHPLSRFGELEGALVEALGYVTDAGQVAA